jgi:MoaE-MoaD fusion protein
VRVHVLFFGLLKDIAGCSSDMVELPDGARLQDLFDLYATRFPRLRELAPSIVLARNQTFESPDAVLADGDEVALLPPVSGGSDRYTHTIQDDAGHFFALTRQRIDTEAVKRQILQPHDGALCDFEGVVRNNTKGRQTLYLDYEGYEPMALAEMARIGREIAASHQVSRVAIVHRLGRLEIGEASVVVAVSSPHRRPSFDAALEGINRLKKTVPIWKKEYFVDGEVWVEGAWDDNVARAAQPPHEAS